MSDTQNQTPSENDVDPAGKPVDATAERVAELEAENQALKDRVLRTMAEMENLRRRTEKEKQDASTYGIAKFAKDILTVADNLSRALNAVPSEARDTADEALKGLIEGVELTERDLLNQLERHKVKRLSPKGEKFDPNFHQAMFEAHNPALPNGFVMEVVQDGYVIGDRVLRPALVGVAKGGPKAAPEQKPEPKPAEPAAEQASAQDPQPQAEQPRASGEHVDRTI